MERNLTPEQIVGLKGVVRGWKSIMPKDSWFAADEHDYQDILAVLSDYAALKAENELNKMLIADLTRDLNEENTRAEKAEVKLERQRPLIEAAKDVVFINGEPTSLHDGADKRLFRAALKIKEEK